MNKEEILKLVVEHKDSFVQIIKAKDREFYVDVNNRFTGKSFSEKLYKHMQSGSDYISKCKQCENETKYLTFGEGYRPYCSTKCANVASAPGRSGSQPMDMEYWEEIVCLTCNSKFFALKFRKQKYCSNKCSANATANGIERLNQIRRTKLERYGNDSYVNPEKARETCLKKYGVNNVSKSPEIIEKIKETNLERYGYDSTFKVPAIKEKIKLAVISKFGVDNVSQSELIKEKKIATYIDRLGVDNPFKSEEIMRRCKENYRKRFGVDYPSQATEVRDKVIETVRKNNYKNLDIVQRGLSKVDLLFSEDEYISMSYKNKYPVKCRKCGNIFDDHFDGNGHPRCLKCIPNIAGFSYAEKEIGNYIGSLISGEILYRDRSVLKNRELDIYIPSEKLAIEYDGLFWHSETAGGKTKEYHLDKLDRCNLQNIRLITIFEDEWINKKDIVKDRLKTILKKNDNKIYARECKIEEISGKHTNMFIDKHHIQGRCPSKVNIGLFRENELVSVMTFGTPRIILGNKQMDRDSYELLRFASNGCIVMGGASRMFQYFLKTYSPKQIISYADRRWSDGKLYETLNSQSKEIVEPSFTYFKPGYAIRYHKFGFRKSALDKKLDIFDLNLTEWENMQLNGWDRIWDCGNFKYEWNSITK